MSYLSDFKELNGRYVAFGGNPKGGKISGKGKIRTGKLDFDDVYFFKELKFNLLSVTYMCDKKNNVLFINTEYIVLFPEFKLPDENQVLLRVPREKKYNKVLVTKPHNNTPYELLLGRTPSIGFMRPFGCPVTILNTLDPLGKFDGKADEGFLVGYSVSSSGPTWLFDIDTLTKTMNYQPVTGGNQSNPSNTDDDDAFGVKKSEFKGRKPESKVHVSPSSKFKGKSPVESSTGYRNLSAEFEDFYDNSINEVNAADSPFLAVGQISTNSTNTFSAACPSNTVVSSTHGKSLYVNTSQYPDDPNMPELEDITYSDDEEDVGAEADFTNLETTITVSPIPTTRVHKYHLVTQIIGDLSSATQKGEELLQFKMQKVWVLVDLSNGKRAIDTKWVFRNKKDERGTVVRNKARLVAQGHTQEKGMDYEEFFAPVVRIEAIRLFLAYASFMGFMVYQMDVKSAFLYGTIEEEVYVCQPFGFEDPDYPDKVYKVVKALYGLHQAPRACQDKYVAEILRKSGLTDGKSANTPIDTENPLLNDPNGEDVDVHTYRSMIGSLMYLTSSRPDIMFAVYACARFQVTPKASHLHAVKRIFRYLKGKPHLGLWYPKDSPFNLVAYSDSDYDGASLDRKSTTGGCQFLGCRLISWQCKNLVDKKKVIITEATIQEALRLDDAESIDCQPNEEIFTELSRMGYEKPSTKLTFYKAFFSLQWKFLIHIILQCMSAKMTSWDEFGSSMALAVIYLSIGDGEKDLLLASELSETNSSGGREDELSYNNLLLDLCLDLDFEGGCIQTLLWSKSFLLLLPHKFEQFQGHFNFFFNF
nr:hypothetical protein [Tanacetum cinerariifolium]